MGKVGMGAGLTVTFSILPLIHSNVEFKHFGLFLPAHRNHHMMMLTVFTRALCNPQLRLDAEANAKYCL